MSAESRLLERLEELGRLRHPERAASVRPADPPDLRECLRLLQQLESLRVPSPSVEAMWNGRSALLAAVRQPRRRFVPLPPALLSWKPAPALPSAVLAATLLAATAGGAVLAGSNTPVATVNDVLSALGLNDEDVQPVPPPLSAPATTEEPPGALETAGPFGLPGTSDAADGEEEQTRGTPAQNSSQGANNPGHGGENPGRGVGPGHEGTPPGQSAENPGQGIGPEGTPPGQSAEPGHGGDSPGHDGAGQGQQNQGNGNAGGNSSKP